MNPLNLRYVICPILTMNPGFPTANLVSERFYQVKSATSQANFWSNT